VRIEILQSASIVGEWIEANVANDKSGLLQYQKSI
jgi:hypothetical protein